MRQRRHQATPFGWVLAVLTGVGMAGGVATGFYANAMHTADALPAEDVQPFETTASVSVVRQTPAAEVSPEALEDFALFSPVLSFPSASHPPAVAVDRSASAPATMVLASLAPQAAPEQVSLEQVAPEPAPTPVPMPPVRHVSAERTGGVLNEAQIASIKKRLKLTPDQASLWPAVEVALRNINYAPKARDLKVASVHSSAPMAYVDPDSNEVQRLKYAAIPLIMRLNEDQKQEVRSMAHVMGLEGVASSF